MVDRTHAIYDGMVQPIAWGKGPLHLVSTEVPIPIGQVGGQWQWQWACGTIMTEANFNAAFSFLVVGSTPGQDAMGWGGWKLP